MIIKIDPRDKEEFKKLVEFAHSFGHEVEDKWTTLVSVSASGEWVGYCQIIDIPSLASGWKESGRDTLKGLKEMKHYLMSQGLGMTWCSTKSPLYKFMGRLGYKPTTMEVFFALPEDPKPIKI